jgi:hypothetical protein
LDDAISFRRCTLEDFERVGAKEIYEKLWPEEQDKESLICLDKLTDFKIEQDKSKTPMSINIILCDKLNPLTPKCKGKEYAKEFLGKSIFFMNLIERVPDYGKYNEKPS